MSDSQINIAEKLLFQTCDTQGVVEWTSGDQAQLISSFCLHSAYNKVFSRFLHGSHCSSQFSLDAWKHYTSCRATIFNEYTTILHPSHHPNLLSPKTQSTQDFITITSTKFNYNALNLIAIFYASTSSGNQEPIEISKWYFIIDLPLHQENKSNLTVTSWLLDAPNYYLCPVTQCQSPIS